MLLEKWRTLRRTIPSLLIGIAICVLIPNALSQPRSDNFNYIHVKFTEEFNPGKPVASQAYRMRAEKFNAVNKKHKALSIRRIFPDAGKFEKAHEAYGLHLWYEIQFRKDIHLTNTLAEYASLEYVHSAEVRKEYTSIRNNEEDFPDAPPENNDPFFGNQWHFSNTGQLEGTPGADINLLNAWEIERGSSDVIVAVIDGGITLNHVDLKQALWINQGEIPNNGIDDDHNGYVDDVHGYNFADRTSAINWDSHATHVAGTIGAVSNNGIGVSGIAGGSGPEGGVRLMSCSGFGNFNIGGFEAAMVYAADNGAVIAQNSWGGGSSAIEAAIDYFIERAGFDNSVQNFNLNIQTGPMAGGVVVFAAGNSTTADPAIGYPASYNKVIAVAATDQNDKKSTFSNYGEWVDIAAPGSSVFSTILAGYGYLSGTSMACPHVAGVAALIVSHYKRQGFTPAEVWDRLRMSARTITDLNPDYDGLLGAGRLDAYIALQEPDEIPPAPISDLIAAKIQSTSVTLQWTATGADEFTGQAAGYELRYSTSPLTEDSFTSGIRIPSMPFPPPTGQMVSYQLTNLSPLKTYFIAIKTRDMFNNISAISNVLMVETVAPASAQLVTTSLTENLYTGGKATREVLVKNVGGDDLQIRLGIPDVMPAPVGYPVSGVGRLFAINPTTNTIDELNTKTGAKVHSIPLPEPSSKTIEGLAFDGWYLYYGRTNKVYKLDSHTGAVVRSFSLNTVTSIRSLAWSGRFLYASTLSNGFRHIYELNTDTGTIVRQLPYSTTGALAIAGNRGSILLVQSGTIQEIDLVTDGTVRIISVGGNPNAIAYSGAENRMFVADQNFIKVLDATSGTQRLIFSVSQPTALAGDGYKPSWLSTDEQVITIAQGETAGISARFIATELPEGQWTGVLSVIPLHDPTNTLTTEVTLNVTSSTDIETIASLNFGKHYVGVSKDTVITIENRGKSELVISAIQSGNNQVTTSLNSLTLPPGQKMPMTVTLQGDQLGNLISSIVLTSNDPDEGLLTIPVYAEILPSPIVQVTPDALNAVLNTGERTTVSFTVSNSGGSPLHWQVNFAASNQPGIEQSSIVQSEYQQMSVHEYFQLKASSPEKLTCLAYDPQNKTIYAKSLVGNTYYTYVLETDTWSAIGFTPSTFAGQATYHNGKIYHGGNQLNIYSTGSNTWTSVDFPIASETGTLTTDGQYIYVVLSGSLYRFNPIATEWLLLASPPRYLTPYSGLSAHSGVVYVHSNGWTGGFTADGNTFFMKYFTTTNSWITSGSIPGKASSGSAIDPSGRRYFAVGAPYANQNNGVQLAIRDLSDTEWFKTLTPFQIGKYSGLTFVGAPGFSGVYLSQGEVGTAFGYYETPPATDWITVEPSHGILAVGETQSFNVHLNATGLDGGVYTGNIRVYQTEPKFEVSVPLTLTVVGAPDISMELPTLTDLGQVEIGRTMTFRSIKVMNKGTAPLVALESISDLPDFSVFPSAFEVPIGESRSFYVAFSPTTEGPQNATITITTNDPDEGILTFARSGTGVYPPVVEVSPGSISVDLISGASSTHHVTISNSGGSILRRAVFAFEIIPKWLKGSTIGAVEPGASISVPITFNAFEKSSGTYTGKILLWYWGDLIGEIPVTMNVTSAADIYVSNESLKYGEQFINHEYDSVIQIKNAGFYPLSITAIDSDNSLFSISAEAPVTLAPGQHIDATILYKPAEVGEHNGKITIISDDPDEASYFITLQGTGVLPPKITSTTAHLNLSAYPNESTTLPIVLENIGGSVLNWRIVEQSSSAPIQNQLGFVEERQAVGDFTLLPPTPAGLLAPVVNPSANIYAQDPLTERLYLYNPGTKAWSQFARTPAGIHNFSRGAAVFLNTNMYCVYAEDDTKIHVFLHAIHEWTTLPNQLGSGTSTITTDGTVLYLAGGGKFKRYNPVTKTWSDLPLPPNMTLSGSGGLSYHAGVIYAHESNRNSFAKYTTETGSWEVLNPIPGEVTTGSAIDPVRNRYYAVGENPLGYNSLYEYDMESNSWTTFTFSSPGSVKGGVVFSTHAAAPGLYIVEGKSGQGFVRYEPRTGFSWLRASQLVGKIDANSILPIGINVNAYNLTPGIYEGEITVTSNDPESPVLDIPVRFEVMNPAPKIEVPEHLTTRVDRFSPTVIKLPIENKGKDPLTWNFHYPLEAWLSADKLSGIVTGLSQDTIVLTFHPGPLPPTGFEQALHITSNDLENRMVLTFLKCMYANEAPMVLASIPDQLLEADPVEFLLQNIFVDADGDALTYVASSTNPSVLSTEISGSVLILHPVKSGSATIMVEASDIFETSVQMGFNATVDFITGIGAGIQEPIIHAYPNPFLKQVRIVYQAETANSAHCILIDATGRTVWRSNDYQETNGTNTIEIDGGDLPAGIYQVMLLRDHGPNLSTRLFKH
jgi:subtilisin family serine protease